MQFIVPKFIEREMKIFGPLTMKTFFALVGFICVMALFYFSLPRKVFYLILALILPLFISSILVKIDGIPLYQLYPSLFSFLFAPKIFVWKGKGTFKEMKFESKMKIPLKKRKSKLSETQILLQTKK